MGRCYTIIKMMSGERRGLVDPKNKNDESERKIQKKFLNI